MNKYIKDIKHKIYEVTDEYKKAIGKTKEYAITVEFNRTSEGKCFKLYIDDVKLKNDLGYELPLADSRDSFRCLTYSSKVSFNFEFDPDFCVLQKGTIFEITLRELHTNGQETFIYKLSDHSWEETS